MLMGALFIDAQIELLLLLEDFIDLTLGIVVVAGICIH